MLSPDHRSLVSSLLTPPPGMILDRAIATTYTLDPVMLLTVPLHLAWLASGEDRTLLSDGIRLFEGLRKITDRLSVYSDRGRIQAPTQGHGLYALLEAMIVEVRAPGKGAFHPKLWVLRFVRQGQEADVRLRLGILSRNMTFDRCWDLALQLEGVPSGKYIAANRELGELIRDLPTFAVRPVPDARRDDAQLLGDEVRRTAWELPGGWDSVAFHVLGRSRKPWSPPPSGHLAVISPFISATVLDALCKTTGTPRVLISRPEVLAALPASTRAKFERCLVLDDAAETEDGEDPSAQSLVGLHAKALILQSGWYTTVFLGSANATAAAMLRGSNIELLAELTGRRKQAGVGGIDDLLSDAGFGAVLAPFDPETLAVIDAVRVEAEKALEAARAAIAASRLSVRCDPHDRDWRMVLCPTGPVDFGGVTVTAWPLSIRGEQAASAAGLQDASEVDFGVLATADVTGLVGFCLKKGHFATSFALNLPIVGLPPDRDGAILRRVINNKDGFLRYLLLLLGETPGGEGPEVGPGAGSSQSWGSGGGVGVTLLEEMVRAFAQDRERLQDVKRVVDRLREGDDADDIVPREFSEVWDIFLQAMGGSK